MNSLSKEFHRLLKRVGKLTDGQVSITDIDWDDGELKNFFVTITPNDGFYKSGRFKFEVRLPDDYPVIPPVVWCCTDIYHPNIDPTEENYCDSSTNVCLNVLDSGTWSSSFGLEGAILGLLFLMHNPNLQDPLSPHFEGGGDEEYFQENVRKYMAGEEFDDLSFDTDFKVIDGILIDDPVAFTETESNNEVKMVDSVENLKIVNDFRHTTDIKITKENSIPEQIDCDANGIALDVTEKCTLNDEHISKIINLESQLDENNDENRQKSSTEINEGDVYTERAGDTSEQDESNDRDIELINIDGECVLLIHRCSNVDDDIEQETDNSTEANQNFQNEVSNSDSIEIHTEANSGNVLCCSTASNNVCNIEEVSIEGTTSHQVESEIKALVPDSEPGMQDKDNRRNDKSKGYGCGAWYTLRTALSKIAHSIGHNKLYRDIGF